MSDESARSEDSSSEEAALRVARRERLFDALDEAAIDVCVLGRRDDVTYATGAEGLWTAGTRQFGAACVLVTESRSVHLMSTWDAGVPPEIGFEQVYGLSWNPAIMGASLRAIPGFSAATRLGVDAWTPGFTRAAGRLAPDAELVVVDDLLRAVRASKMPAEIDRLAAASDAVRGACDAVIVAMGAGASPVEGLRTVFSAMAAVGTTAPTSAPVVTSSLVDLGFLVDGYEGTTAQSFTDGRPDEPPALLGELVSACRPGATGLDLQRVAARAQDWIVRGTGMGFEPPSIDREQGASHEIAQGMVLAVDVTGPEGHRRRDVVHVGSDSAVAL